MFENITKATPEDIPALLSLFVHCTDRMLEQGIKQWDYTYPNKQTVTSDIETEACFVFKENGLCLATISLNEQQDEQYQQIKWAFEVKKVLVIHRLAVHPDAQGRGLGTLLTRFATHFAKSEGYEAIRLDAYLGNPSSNHIYIKLGYSQAEGHCYFHGNEIPFACYEKLID